VTATRPPAHTRGHSWINDPACYQGSKLGGLSSSLALGHARSDTASGIITGTGPAPAPPAEDARRLPGLLVTCWCERTYLRVPAAVVVDGRTGSCGHRQCHP
jgi:hypothetical protein